MGADSRKAPPLPAPTETDSNTGRETELDSKVTDRTTYSLPSDGSPVTIRTKNRANDHSLSSNNKSQTSLLIEYFEGGKPGQAESRRPSVRVKVTPSSKGGSRSAKDHIQITERKGTRKPSYTKRIQLSPNAKGDKSPGFEGDDNSVKSYRSATEESNVTSRGGEPIDIEIMPKRHGSPLIPAGEGSSKYAGPNGSDISSMPADSFLDGKTGSPESKRSRSLTRGEALVAGAATGLAAAAVGNHLKTPSRRRSRSLSRERIVAQKAVEKVRGDKSERRRKHRSRSRSVSGEHLTEGTKSPRRRSSRSHHEDSMVSGGASLLNSQVSGKSGDQYSFRSGTSKSSINNPKLLETVEDAIRRLILPELATLKREQSKHAQRERDRRGSFTSGSGVSRDSREETASTKRLSERGSGQDLQAKQKTPLKDGEVGHGKSRKDRIKYEDSPRSFEREASEETVIRDGDPLRKSRSGDKHRGLEAAAVGAGIGALAAAAVHRAGSQDSLGDKKERRRRRTKSRSRSGSVADGYDEQEEEPPPPMPLMSDINTSELTRSSILSADTERPHSASQEPTPVREVLRGVGSPASRTPTRTPVGLQGLGIQHSHYSHENLSSESQHSEQRPREREYELDEQGRKVPVYHEDHEDHEVSYIEGEHDGGHSRAVEAGLAGAAVGAGVAAMRDHYDQHDDPELLEEDPGYGYYQDYQEVPPPLRYVPYAQERRGLSPIQSVSGYTEGEPESQQQRNSGITRSTGSYSSLSKSAPVNSSARSAKSVESAGNALENRHDFKEVRYGGLADSELTQDGEYWEEQHRENDRNRDLDSESYRSSDPRIDYKHMTNYTDDSMDTPALDHVATGQNVQGIGANPDYIHTPVAVESAVASLLTASELTSASGQYERRESYASYDEGSEGHFTSRKNSPSKRDTFGTDQELPSQQNSPSKYEGEYELDEQGRKISMPKYKNTHTLEKAGLAGIAAGAVAHVLAKERQERSATDRVSFEGRSGNTGAPLQKSFKDRAREGQGQMLSPSQSIDVSPIEAASPEQLKMTASGIPDIHDPLPEVGYGGGDSDVTTNPSIIQGPIGGAPEGSRDHWPSHATPPRKPVPSSRSLRSDPNLKAAEAALLGAAVGAGATAAAAGHNRDVSRETNDEDWQRTSGERKRDTLVTNPYEGTSPIAAIGSGLDRDLLGQTGFQDVNREFGPSKLGYPGSPGALPKDEGYISAAPNARSAGGITPEPRMKGVGFRDDEMGDAADDMGDDPFYTPKHSRHLSGMSQGMHSPLYDSATGTGIDRIQSKDIIALMDHVSLISMDQFLSLIIQSSLFAMLNGVLVILRYSTLLFGRLPRCGTLLTI